ncbi:MAG TPA: hypothetical protein VET85_00035 [Stellaceae bacterium]|nr:hypothetical protein [Stellaceae bacterium]
MTRRALLLTGMCLGILPALGVVWAQEKTVGTPSASSLAEIKKAVVAASGYDDEAVELKAGPHQIEVAVANGKLLDASRAARVNEANRIVGAVAKAIAGKPEFASVDAVHIDYIRRNIASGHVDLVDAIDFRKDPSGDFKYHIS